ncbi:MAG: Smr/MutS family protein [Bacteroidota bacterium]
MRYRVGQRVRMLHASGEGVVTALVDKHHVEVDLGDDFPIDVHVDELVPVDSSELSYLGEKGTEPKAVENQQPQLRGASILDLSLVVSKAESGIHQIYLANPELTDKLITLYKKQGSQYQLLDAIQMEAGAYQEVARLGHEELGKTRAFLVQVLAYKPGKSHPHSPYNFELNWNKSRLSQKQKLVNFLEEKAWLYSLREDNQKLDVEAIQNHEFIRIKNNEQQRPKSLWIEVDLHAEALGINPYQSSSSDILQAQLAEVHKVLSDALVQNYDRVVFIHGIGEGKLKKAVHEILKETSHVKNFAPADIHKYGNGATEVFFR